MHERFPVIFRTMHNAVRRNIQTIGERSGGSVPEEDRPHFAEFTRRFLHFLHGHHAGEDTILFPSILKAAEARPNSDGIVDVIANVKSKQGEHRNVTSVCEELGAAADAAGAGGPLGPVHDAITRLNAMLQTHLEEEEHVVSPKVLKELMTAAEVETTAEALKKHGQRSGGPSVVMLLIHSFTTEEQLDHFGAMPWFVRRILVKQIWARSYRPLLKFSYTKECAL